MLFRNYRVGGLDAGNASKSFTVQNIGVGILEDMASNSAGVGFASAEYCSVYQLNYIVLTIVSGSSIVCMIYYSFVVACNFIFHKLLKTFKDLIVNIFAIFIELFVPLCLHIGLLQYYNIIAFYNIVFLTNKCIHIGLVLVNNNKLFVVQSV